MRTTMQGCGTALVTPFGPDLSVDEAGLASLVESQIEAGVDFLVPCGSTGEAATLTGQERARVVAVVAEKAAGRVPVMAGAGASSTTAALALSRAATAAGATHLLIAAPPYNRPPQRGLIEHFTALADAGGRPIVLYNVPGRTGCDIEAETTLRLAEHPAIVGIKEASADLTKIGEILRHRPPGFTVLSGDDALTLPLMALGADGVISVVSNAAPRAMSGLVRAMLSGELEAARALQDILAPLMSAAFVESNPIPIKAALASLGGIENVLRPPLAPLAAEHRALLLRSMRHALLGATPQAA